MKRVSALVAVSLLLALVFATPVAADTEDSPELTVKAKGYYTLQLSLAPGYELEDEAGKLSFIVDSESGTVEMEVKFGGHVLFPYLGDLLPPEQLITGLCRTAELVAWDVSGDGSSVTLDIAPSQVVLLPSGDSLGTEPGLDLVGPISGNKVTFAMGDPNFTELIGILKVK